MGVGHLTPKIRPDGSTLLTSTRRRTRSSYRLKPSRSARIVPSSSDPVARYAQCAGGSFFFATGSKSNTLSACRAVGMSAGSCRWQAFQLFEIIPRTIRPLQMTQEHRTGGEIREEAPARKGWVDMVNLVRDLSFPFVRHFTTNRIASVVTA